MMHKGLIFLSFCSVIFGCRKTDDSSTTSLDSGPKPEGFLVIKNLVPESGKEGSFRVTCASASGDKEVVYSQKEIEKNEVCLAIGAAPRASVSPKPSPAASVTPTEETVEASEPPVSSSSSSKGFVVALVNQSTYVKATESMNVSSAASLGLKVGQDFCVMSKSLSVTQACKTQKNEVKVSGVNLAGCSLTSGYLYSPHVSVTPSIDACP